MVKHCGLCSPTYTDSCDRQEHSFQRREKEQNSTEQKAPALRDAAVETDTVGDRFFHKKRTKQQDDQRNL